MSRTMAQTMHLKGLYRRRNAIGAIALVGVLFYAALIPLHFTSQATIALFEAEAGAASQIVCHGMRDGDRSKPAHRMPDTKCPFCQGLAGFQLAIETVNDLGLLPMPVFAPAPPPESHAAPSIEPRAPQNRGPPPGGSLTA